MEHINLNFVMIIFKSVFLLITALNNLKLFMCQNIVWKVLKNVLLSSNSIICNRVIESKVIFFLLSMSYKYAKSNIDLKTVLYLTND